MQLDCQFNNRTLAGADLDDLDDLLGDLDDLLGR